jgi:hypothetical protein
MSRPRVDARRPGDHLPGKGRYRVAQRFGFLTGALSKFADFSR